MWALKICLFLCLWPGLILAKPRIKDPVSPARDLRSFVHKKTPGKLFPSGISASNVKQGWLDNCNMVAPMAAVAQARPDLVRRAIMNTRNKGWYRVAFEGHPSKGPKRTKGDSPNPKSTMVTAEVPYRSHSSNAPVYARSPSGKYIWAAVWEKAYAKRYGAGKGYEKLNHGGPFSDVFFRLVGGTTEGLALNRHSFEDKAYQKEIWDKLTNALRGDKPKPVAASVPKRESQIPQGRDVHDWHCYAITGVATRKGKREVYLYNPHANSSRRGSHFVMPLEEFIASFNGMTISTPAEE